MRYATPLCHEDATLGLLGNQAPRCCVWVLQGSCVCLGPARVLRCDDGGSRGQELLKALGARETPTGDDLANFLFELGTECDSQPLNPNELSGVVKVLEALAELWSGRGGRRLLVPNAGGVLVESSRCFRCEDRMLLERVDRDRYHATQWLCDVCYGHRLHVLSHTWSVDARC